jgi:uncharacterized protein (DUF1778 family)
MFKLSPETNAMIETAAEFEGITRSDFVEKTSRRAAARVVRKVQPPR